MPTIKIDITCGNCGEKMVEDNWDHYAEEHIEYHGYKCNYCPNTIVLEIKTESD